MYSHIWFYRIPSSRSDLISVIIDLASNGSGILEILCNHQECHSASRCAEFYTLVNIFVNSNRQHVYIIENFSCYINLHKTLDLAVCVPAAPFRSSDRGEVHRRSSRTRTVLGFRESRQKYLAGYMAESCIHWGNMKASKEPTNVHT
jgi:hypothetical protein